MNTVVLDLDGTLADTMRDLIPVLNRTTAKAGLPAISMTDVGHVVGHGAKAMIARAFAHNGAPLTPALHDRLFEDFLKDYEANVAANTVLFDGAADAIEVLAGQGNILAVCTNKVEFLARKLLAELGVAGCFTAITGGDTFPFRKPDARHLLETVRLAGGDPAMAIMVGDSETDIATARNAAIPVIAVDFGYCERPVCEHAPDRIISTFRQLPEAVSELFALARQ
jgi:phosphoglycolate phosphatase